MVPSLASDFLGLHLKGMVSLQIVMALLQKGMALLQKGIALLQKGMVSLQKAWLLLMKTCHWPRNVFFTAWYRLEF